MSKTSYIIQYVLLYFLQYNIILYRFIAMNVDNIFSKLNQLKVIWNLTKLRIVCFFPRTKVRIDFSVRLHEVRVKLECKKMNWKLERRARASFIWHNSLGNNIIKLSNEIDLININTCWTHGRQKSVCPMHWTFFSPANPMHRTCPCTWQWWRTWSRSKRDRLSQPHEPAA